jgi:hypothetical protein
MNLSRFNSYEYNAKVYRSSQGDYEGCKDSGAIYELPTAYGYPAWESAIAYARTIADCQCHQSDRDDFRITLNIDGHEFPECYLAEISDLVEEYFNQKDKE